MRKRLYDGWKGMGDCSCCRHKDICREQCEANEEFASRLVKKELLFDLEKQRELLQDGKTQDKGGGSYGDARGYDLLRDGQSNKGP